MKKKHSKRTKAPLLSWMMGTVMAAFSRSETNQRAASLLRSGRMTLVGPNQPCKGIPRGYFNPAALSQAMNLEEDPAELDRHYLRHRNLKSDLGLILRSLWAALLSGKAVRETGQSSFDLFGVIVNNGAQEGILRTIDRLLMGHTNLIRQRAAAEGHPGLGPERRDPCHITFVNANNFNLALEQKEYLRILKDSDLVLPDGIGVKVALRMAGGRLASNLNGTDLFPRLMELAERLALPVYLLGGEPEVSARAKAYVERNHPGVEIAGTHHGYFQQDQEAEICEQINVARPAMVIVGMGTPRQEHWFARNQHRLHVPMVLCMGGLLDFIGGKNQRAPLWMRQAGLEWVFRIIQEPKRMWRRYIIGNPKFLLRARRWVQSRRESSAPNPRLSVQSTR